VKLPDGGVQQREQLALLLQDQLHLEAHHRHELPQQHLEVISCKVGECVARGAARATAEENEAERIVKFLKNTGNAFIINSLTHLGTVVYQKSEHEKYVHLTSEANIRKVLDVKNKTKFAHLWGWENYPDDPLKNHKFLQNFLSAHLHVYRFTNTIRANATIK